MLEERLNYLSVLSVENDDITKSLPYAEVIKRHSAKEFRKKVFVSGS